MSAPRTILLVASAPFFSGAERALLVLVDHLDPAEYRPIVVVGHDGELHRELQARQIETLHIPLAFTGLKTVAAFAQSVGRLSALMLSRRPSLVHSNDAPSFQAAGYAARLVGLPAITHVRFPDTAEGFGWFLKPGFRRALFVSEAARREAVAAAPTLFSGKSDVVYDGVVMRPLPGDDERIRLKSELGLPLDRAIVAISGQVDEVKGIWEFVEAARLLIQRGVAASFAVLGDDLRNGGLMRREMEAKVATLGLTPYFHFLGFRPNAPELIAAFDVVAMPSHVEPLGLAVLEAGVAGRPVVGASVGGICETIADGVTGTLVEPKHAAALASALEGLILNPDQARAFGRAGRARVEQHFSGEAHAARMQQIYDEQLRAERRAEPAAESRQAW